MTYVEFFTIALGGSFLFLFGFPLLIEKIIDKSVEKEVLGKLQMEIEELKFQKKLKEFIEKELNKET